MAAVKTVIEDLREAIKRGVPTAMKTFWQYLQWVVLLATVAGLIAAALFIPEIQNALLRVFAWLGIYLVLAGFMGILALTPFFGQREITNDVQAELESLKTDTDALVKLRSKQVHDFDQYVHLVPPEFRFDYHERGNPDQFGVQFQLDSGLVQPAAIRQAELTTYLGCKQGARNDGTPIAEPHRVRHLSSLNPGSRSQIPDQTVLVKGKAFQVLLDECRTAGYATARIEVSVQFEGRPTPTLITHAATTTLIGKKQNL